jgi:diadenosine tetraphosphate (Ap4A) HIT family hydrolase
MLVLPAAHIPRPTEGGAALREEIQAVTDRVAAAVRAAFGATGATILRNDGAPDQDLLHLHIHVIPRGAGDGFRMPDPEGELLAREERRRQALALRRALG